MKLFKCFGNNEKLLSFPESFGNHNFKNLCFVLYENEENNYFCNFLVQINEEFESLNTISIVNLMACSKDLNVFTKNNYGFILDFENIDNNFVSAYIINENNENQELKRKIEENDIKNPLSRKNELKRKRDSEEEEEDKPNLKKKKCESTKEKKDLKKRVKTISSLPETNKQQLKENESTDIEILKSIDELVKKLKNKSISLPCLFELVFSRMLQDMEIIDLQNLDAEITMEKMERILPYLKNKK